MGYEPKSSFLIMVANGEAPLSGSFAADHNLTRLLSIIHNTSSDITDLDWAVFLLARSGLDTPAVRAALEHALSSNDAIVRGEALCGLAMRDVTRALPYVRNELGQPDVSIPTIEAAQLCADASLLEGLRRFADPSDDSQFDSAVADAIAACELNP